MVLERTYRGMTTADRAAQRRRQLLDATLDLWGDAGRPGVTMTGVCRRAGLTERYFYESFDHLDAALVAVLQQIAADVERSTVAGLAAAGPLPEDRVRACVEAFVRTLTDDPRKGRVAVVEASALDATRPHRSLLLRRFARLTGREVRRLHGPQAWAEPAGALAAGMFVGGVAQLVTSWLDGTLSVEPDEIVTAAIAAFITMAHA